MIKSNNIILLTVKWAYLINAFVFLSFGSFQLTPVKAEQSSVSEHLELLRTILSSRHYDLSLASLTELAKGEDNLIDALLTLRLENKPPVLGSRAEKILLAFTNRDDVRSALLDDVLDAQRYGLGSVVLSNLDLIKDETFKEELISKVKGEVLLKKDLSPREKRFKAILEAR